MDAEEPHTANHHPNNGQRHRHHHQHLHHSAPHQLSDSNNNNNNNNSNNHHSTNEMEPFQIDYNDGRPLQTSYRDVPNDDAIHVLEDGEEIMYPIEKGGHRVRNGNDDGDVDNDNNNKDYHYTVNYTGWLSPEWEDYFYPPSTPPECQLWRRENIAIPACYLLVGLLQGLSSVAVNVLPLDLGATEAQQTTVSSIRSLPSSFKLLFGFVSDNVPIAGYRRKPYMLLGWFIAALSMLSLFTMSNLNVPARNAGCFHSKDDPDYQQGAIPDDAPTIPFLSLCLLMFGVGFWMADVMGDSVVAEKAKLEPDYQRGSIQSTCYACRFFGMMIAAPASTALYTKLGPQAVIQLLAILPLGILPLVYVFGETRNAVVASTRQQCYEIWNTVCSRAVWQPMAFVYIYNVMQVGNAAWREYLVTVQNFTSCQLNLLLIVSFILLYFGILAYKYYFIHWSWRNVYICTTLLNGLFSILQILLIYGITFGLSPFLFTLGDDAFSEFIAGIQFLPTTIMMVHLCPAGSEGASYAMFTTVNNSALTLSSAISTQLLKIWDVSRAALAAGNVQGMINLSYFTTAFQVGAIVFVGLLPRYKEDLAVLGHGSNQSQIGGFIFLLITFSSIAYAVCIGVLNIVNPGWMGES
jgi:BT1 family